MISQKTADMGVFLSSDHLQIYENNPIDHLFLAKITLLTTCFFLLTTRKILLTTLVTV